MSQSKKDSLVIVGVLLLSMMILSLSIISDTNVEFELKGAVVSVIDGDTFDMITTNGTQYRIRLADVDAPERDEAGYAEAKEHLKMLIYGNAVYLDVDDMYMWDNYGSGSRLVSVVYTEYNITHYLNVNEALVKAGYVQKKDYANEFNPYLWSLYMPKQESTAFPSNPILTLITIALIALSVVYLNRKFQRQKT